MTAEEQRRRYVAQQVREFNREAARRAAEYRRQVRIRREVLDLGLAILVAGVILFMLEAVCRLR